MLFRSDLLAATRADGRLSACSFAHPTPKPVTDLRRYYAEPQAFSPFRDHLHADEPCRSCTYLSLCRGGCRVVAAHVSGSQRDPDPECPRVIAYREKSAPTDAASPPRHRLKVLA